MSQKKVFVYGAGGHGKVVADILLASGECNLAGFVDDRAELHGTSLMGLPVPGDGEWLRRAAREGRAAVALGVGDNHVRQELAERCAGWGIELLTAIHPRGCVARSARLGMGTVVMAGAVINAEARLGQGVIANTGAVIEHDVVIADFAQVAPNASLGGAARLGTLSLLGLGASVLPGVTIGSETIVGAGAVVHRFLPDRVVAAGVPARILRHLGEVSQATRDAAASEVLR